MPHGVHHGPVPSVRCRYMKTFLNAVDRLDASSAREIRTAIGRAAMELIGRSHSLAWIGAEHNLVATQAVHRVVGPADAYDFFRRMLGSQYDTALFRGFTRTIVRLFGTDPGRYLKWVGRGYDLAFRGVGRWEVGPRLATSATLRLCDLPEPFLRDEAWTSTACGSLHSVLDLAGRVGEVTVRPPEMGSWVEYSLVWN